MLNPIRKLSQKKNDSIENGAVCIVYLGDKPNATWLSQVEDVGYQLEIVTPDEFAKSHLAFQVDAVLLHFNEKTLAQVRSRLGELKRINDNLPVVCGGPVSRVEDVVALMKSGAYDLLETPFMIPKMIASLEHAIENYKLTRRVSLLESQVHWEGDFDGIVGVSAAMIEVFQMIKTVAKSNATVLILGESGTGKELVAKAIHKHSDRDKGKFIDINCGAIPKELLENELFGHERGSYTGADRQYIGSVERADKGTLFLDEIGEMDTNLQVKLLRLLQERTFQRIGGNKKMQIDIRVIAATNRDLIKEVERGTFREELYYRLNVVPITLPPLRTRREDIPLLGNFFLQQFSKANGRRFKDFTPDALQALVNYNWPGNVRELENTIERVVVLHDEIRVKPAHFPRFIQKVEQWMPPVDKGADSFDPHQKIIPLAQLEQCAIESTLAKCNGDVVLAAKKLQIGQATLYRKIKRYGIK